jgi:hypothetical protein
MAQITDTKWLAALFEFEVCSECGHDADQHTVARDGLGNRRFICTDPIPAGLPDVAAEKELKRRAEASTR